LTPQLEKVMNERRRTRVAKAILDYLRKHPEAQDTLAGIAQWWLPQQDVRSRMATVKEALNELVRAGLISEHEGKDAQISYRLTKPGLDIRRPRSRRNEA
jgi:Fe2+ or Zn2+ uptake regulation protein